MINLLPPELKQSYHYAYRNVRLIRWVIAFGLSFIGLMVISVAGLIFMQQSTQTYAAQVTSEQNLLNQQKLSETQSDVQNISNNLKLAVQVLSQEVLFSKLLQQLASVTPSSAILTNLDLNPAQSGVTITAQTASYSAATQLQVNLADPANQIFTNADILSINCLSASEAAGSPTTAQYPCTTIIRALFAANNPYLFINSKGQ
jgi:Tfp pilus assembly protein PilN